MTENPFREHLLPTPLDDGQATAGSTSRRAPDLGVEVDEAFVDEARDRPDKVPSTRPSRHPGARRRGELTAERRPAPQSVRPGASGFAARRYPDRDAADSATRFRITRRPSRVVRLLGLGALLGAIFWPVALVVLASAAAECASADCLPAGPRHCSRSSPSHRSASRLDSLGLERRAARLLGMLDFVGDLSIGTAAACSSSRSSTGSIGLVGPGLLLLLIGSVDVRHRRVVRNGARPRLASAVVAIGAAGTILFLPGAAAAGGRLRNRPREPSMLAPAAVQPRLGLAGRHLLLARPLVIPDRR